ncbi:MAG: crossover junction endodeoxyribonuclease RuvC, partial [Pseudobdellovibrionaceae bacterium]|nr:crossover junction endodeoxyribonuclease RuvC [Pseudobdellovibrionaceae bacterium]
MTNPDFFRIIGIDPGSRITGFAGLELPRGSINLKRVHIVAVGVIRSKTTLPHSERTGYLHEAVHQLAGQYKPE